MLKDIGVKVVVIVLVTFCAAQLATAGWFDDAVENATERVGTRAVDEAADGAYDAAKDAAFGKKGGTGREEAQGTSSSAGGSSFKEQERHRPAAGLSGEAIDDDHFIQNDDFFVAETALEKNSYIYVSLAKMVTEPSARSKGEAEFFKVTDGGKVWSKYYHRSRIAHDGELRLGAQVIAFDSHQDEGVYLAPVTKEDARGGTWFLAKITDTSDLYRGYLTVSGNYKVSLKNLRILLPKTPPAAR
jgi:hypothetical protein